MPALKENHILIGSLAQAKTSKGRKPQLRKGLSRNQEGGKSEEHFLN